MSGEGGLFKRTRKHPDGTEYTRWIAQVSYGPRHDRRVVRRVRPTKREAKAALDELQGPRRSTLALGAYLRSWLDETAGPTLAPNTKRGYEAVIASAGPISGIPLAELRPEDLEAWLNRLPARRRGQAEAEWKPASPKTRKNALAMLRKALEVAHRRHHVAENVAELVSMPRIPKQKRPVITPILARAVLEATAKDRYAAAYALALCGLRNAEILGLQWEDVDLEAATVQVRYQLVGSGKRASLTPVLKSDMSESPLPLPAFVSDRLREHRASQLEERISTGQSTEDGLVFVTPRGLAVNGTWLTKHFQELLATAGLQSMRLHDLRHGTATLLAEAGVDPRLMQDYLRHAQVTTTLGVYTHVAKGRQRDAADALERMVTG